MDGCWMVGWLDGWMDVGWLDGWMDVGWCFSINRAYFQTKRSAVKGLNLVESKVKSKELFLQF